MKHDPRIRDTIAGNWETYRKCMPADASPWQVRDTRRAFYGGALMMFSVMTRVSEERTEDEAMAAMDGLWEEIGAFNALLQAGLV